MSWMTLLRRTEYPKLGYLIRRFEDAGIPCRFERSADGKLMRTFHSSHILQIPDDMGPQAWKILDEPWARIRGAPSLRGSTTLDDMPDDHPAFAPFANVVPQADGADAPKE